MSIPALLWRDSSKTVYLLVAAAVLFTAMLGGAELRGPEWRWAVIADGMMRAQDYLHPYYFDDEYYDKPLGSFWLIVLAARVIGGLNEWSVRLPSVLAGLLVLWCTVRLGRERFTPATGLLAGCMLATCPFFAIWARTGTADMLNVAGTVAAVTWYFERKQRPDFIFYFVLFAILAIASWMKGLVAPAIAFLVILPDLWREGNWRAHLRPALAAAAVAAIVLYLTPFVLSAMTGDGKYESSGLGLVYRENILRFIAPFDHEGPVYLYLLGLPLYLLPWGAFLPFAIWRTARDWKRLAPASRWVAYACLLVFLFLSATGSRRSHYVLPLLPFAVLLVADWVIALAPRAPRLERASGWIALAAGALILLWVAVALPYASSIGGVRLMTREARAAAVKIAPWPEWSIAFWNAVPRSSAFAFRPLTPPQRFFDRAALRALLARYPHTIIVTRAQYCEELEELCGRSLAIAEKPRVPTFLRQADWEEDSLVALIPRF